jgi:hypothetical protein
VWYYSSIRGVFELRDPIATRALAVGGGAKTDTRACYAAPRTATELGYRLARCPSSLICPCKSPRPHSPSAALRARLACGLCTRQSAPISPHLPTRARHSLRPIHTSPPTHSGGESMHTSPLALAGSGTHTSSHSQQPTSPPTHLVGGSRCCCSPSPSSSASRRGSASRRRSVSLCSARALTGIARHKSSPAMFKQGITVCLRTERQHGDPSLV